MKIRLFAEIWTAQLEARFGRASHTISLREPSPSFPGAVVTLPGDVETVVGLICSLPFMGGRQQATLRFFPPKDGPRFHDDPRRELIGIFIRNKERS